MPKPSFQYDSNMDIYATHSNKASKQAYNYFVLDLNGQSLHFLGPCQLRIINILILLFPRTLKSKGYYFSGHLNCEHHVNAQHASY